MISVGHDNTVDNLAILLEVVHQPLFGRGHWDPSHENLFHVSNAGIATLNLLLVCQLLTFRAVSHRGFALHDLRLRHDRWLLLVTPIATTGLGFVLLTHP